MKVKFRTNLGSNDADRLRLDFKQCCEGMACEVDSPVGEKLVSSGVAVDVTPPPEKTEAIKPAETKPKPKPVEPPAETSKPSK
jgi:hypothetical protein